MPFPKTQTAAILNAPGPSAVLDIRHDVPVVEPKKGEALIKMECTGFCHSDVHFIRGELPMTTDIPGHEGVGRVVRVGPDTSTELVGRRVGVKWIYDTCMTCDICASRYTQCPNQNNSGRNVRGTFQEYAISPQDFVTPIPESLDPYAAAPLLCAGITMYGALKKLDKFCKRNDSVVIVGAGGGLGHLGIQIGEVMGYRIIAIDSEPKRGICLASGASAFVDFASKDVAGTVQDLTNGWGAHAVIVAVGAPAGYELGVKLLRPLGTLVCVGLSSKDFHVPISPLGCLNSGYNIVGSSVGTEEEMQELLQLAETGRVAAHYQVFDFDRANDVLEKLQRYEIQGRVVLRFVGQKLE